MTQGALVLYIQPFSQADVVEKVVAPCYTCTCQFVKAYGADVVQLV